MLEHATLLIHPWTRTTLDGAEAWLRSITDAAGRSLGFVRLNLASLSWLFWVRKPQLEVFETEDAAHLLSVTRSWTMLSIWDVHDAEERFVGRIYPKSIVAGEGESIGFLDQERILDAHGNAILRFSKRNGGVVEVAFGADTASNPFLRMMLLGCVLTLEPKPKEPRTK